MSSTEVNNREDDLYYIREALREDINQSHVWLSAEIMNSVFGDYSRVSRPLIKLSREGCRSVYAEALQIDRRVTDELEKRKPCNPPSKDSWEPTTEEMQRWEVILKRTVLLNHWQRRSLNLNRTGPKKGHSWKCDAGVWTRKVRRANEITGGDPPLLITPCGNVVHRLWAAISIARQHPQAVVRCSFQLGLWSIILGFISIAYSMYSTAITTGNANLINMVHWLFLALAIPVLLMGVVLLWLGLFIFPICVVIRWCRKD